MPPHLVPHLEVDDCFFKNVDHSSEAFELVCQTANLVQVQVCYQRLADALFLPIEIAEWRKWQPSDAILNLKFLGQRLKIGAMHEGAALFVQGLDFLFYTRLTECN